MVSQKLYRNTLVHLIQRRDIYHQVFHGKPLVQFAVTRLQFYVARISDFSKASIQFSVAMLFFV